MTTLAKGANTVLTSAAGPPVGSALVGVTWPNAAADLDLVALVCGPDRRVLGDDHFLFWDQPTSPAKETFLRSVPPGAVSPSVDRAQLLINLDLVGPAVECVYIALANIADGGNLAQCGGFSVRFVDLADGTTLVDYTNPGTYTTESCLILVELYRYQGQWKLRAVDQGYAGGLAAFGRDHGVDIA